MLYFILENKTKQKSLFILSYVEQKTKRKSIQSVFHLQRFALHECCSSHWIKEQSEQRRPDARWVMRKSALSTLSSTYPQISKRAVVEG